MWDENYGLSKSASICNTLHRHPKDEDSMRRIATDEGNGYHIAKQLCLPS